MNILIPNSWLKDYLETRAKPEKIAECLSLCSASVEKIIKTGNDAVFDIEITSNRPDMMSVLGVARELTTILPQFKISASLKKDPYKKKLKLKTTSKSSVLKVQIKNHKLCPRFTAAIIKNITIKPSPKTIQDRLIKAGLRPINNLVDITNYLMKELGQPFHVFDWDEIKKQTMILRNSEKGERITTLDGQTHTLPGNDIVIEDGSGRLIDLCGIMGGAVSHVTNKTKNILLFVQIYDPVLIRRTSMKLGKRTEAAALFEKSPDPEMILPAINKGINLIENYASGTVFDKIIDIYPKPSKPQKIKVPLQLIKQYLGADITPKRIQAILDSLGFHSLFTIHKSLFTIQVPSWRAKDINIPEDIVEEVARIFGYHNMSSFLPPLYFKPEKPDFDFSWETKTKNLLKNLGFTEIYSYSFQSEEELLKFGFEPKKHLKIKNPLTEDWVYLRKNLLPSLLKVLKQNQNLKENINIFELSNVYLPKKADLPEEKLKLALLMTGKQFYQLKGIIEVLLSDLGIRNFVFKPVRVTPKYWQPAKTAQIKITKKEKTIKLGFVGEINQHLGKKFDLKSIATCGYLDFKLLLSLATDLKKYRPIPKYPPLFEDLTFVINPKTYYINLLLTIKSISKLVKKVSFIGRYKDNLTFRITYQNPKANLSERQVSKIRQAIIAKVKQKGLAKLKGKD
ncbi:MAG TPA: phenylalanine--tRNA ligase subunit beta [Candidatus Bathyarchaeia archaeon]|nr:phenylalanine--tRNA ligase subunit beta [Candidatus Bathyarchaeia archaeon]